MAGLHEKTMHRWEHEHMGTNFTFLVAAIFSDPSADLTATWILVLPGPNDLDNDDATT